MSDTCKKLGLFNDYSWKSIVTSECHLNAFLESLPYISEEKIASEHCLHIQAMGLEARVSSLRLFGEKDYTSFSFNQSKRN